jgi:2'-5' RNA ligase
VPPAPLRCFVGAFITAESARRLQTVVLARLGRDLLAARSTRQVPRADYHVTLKFLGELSSAAVPQVLSVVDSLGGHPLTGQVAGLTGFPRSARARLVAAELAEHAQLGAWWSQLEARFGAENRPFRPHVTVVRLGRPRSFEPIVLPEPMELALEAPRLYRSDRTAERARYRPVAAD